MDKIEVDPKLFITCRLCLEELGVYQIVPTVKEKISYCFDIKVEPFDGMPQLICKKCEAILNNYAILKETIVSKQNGLITKLRGNKMGQFSKEPVEARIQGTPALKSTDDSDQNESEEIPIKAISSKNRPRISSTSSSDTEYPKIPHDNDKIGKETTAVSWSANYKKEYVCRVCDFRWVNIKSMLGHFSARHYSLINQYKNIFKRHCEVKLYSFNSKLNITGSRHNIMLDKDKIIVNDNPKFYIMYTPKHKSYEEHSFKSNPGVFNTKRVPKRTYLESSDSDDDFAKPEKKKRVYSRSSNETVILDQGIELNNVSDNENVTKSQIPNKKEKLVVNECINIDDSSDSEVEKNENEAKSKNKAQDLVSEASEQSKNVKNTIDEIIAGSIRKYRRKRFHNEIMIKSNKNPTEIATQLKRKILSIGRKIINSKKSLNCTPLLRFMEYKNLDISWCPKSMMYVNLDSSYIRIFSRLKNANEIYLDEPGWININNASLNSTNEQVTIPDVSDNSRKEVGIAENAEREPCKDPKGKEDSNLSILTITLQNESASFIGTDTRKLLNANPVANPKQLPKKTVNNEVKASIQQIISNVEDTPSDSNSNECCLPIITSTTSLADHSYNSKTNIPDSNTTQTIINNAATTEAPRIKVKSVTELMSKETLSWMNKPVGDLQPCVVNPVQQMPINNDNNRLNIYIPYAVPQLQNALQTKNVPANMFQSETTGKNNYVILDTVELPNTTTDSPFDYFRKLLHVHNIRLLDIDVIPSPEFHCLLKFKVVFKQPEKQHPVILSLSLFCLKNVFLLTIKDRNQENINLSKISANWQWEVLKVYKGEVIDKILLSAQKVSQEVYEYANSFLCLLKSINYVNPL